MRYKVEYSRLFKKSFQRCLKRGLDPLLFKEVISILANDGRLPAKYKPHKLSGKYNGLWECHIKADWLLVWEQFDESLHLILIQVRIPTCFETNGTNDIQGQVRLAP